MRTFSLDAYTAAHASQVADLMASARKRRRAVNPLLPSGLDDPETSLRIMERLETGSVALAADGRLLGYMFAERQEDPTWGPAIVVETDRHALAPDADVSVLAHLYAAECEAKASGLIEHYAYCPAEDRTLLEAWFHLSFGLEQAYGAVRLEEMEAAYSTGDGIEIRRARAGDEDLLGELSPLITLMQAGAPVWAGAPEDYLREIREGFRSLATDPDWTVYLAFRAGKAVGYQGWLPMAAHPTDGTVAGGIELHVTATVPEERGTGVCRMLTALGVSEARKAGYSICCTDWRTTNPLSSTFWTGRGFKPFRYRLVRKFNPRFL